MFTRLHVRGDIEVSYAGQSLGKWMCADGRMAFFPMSDTGAYASTPVVGLAKVQAFLVSCPVIARAIATRKQPTRDIFAAIQHRGFIDMLWPGIHHMFSVFAVHVTYDLHIQKLIFCLFQDCQGLLAYQKNSRRSDILATLPRVPDGLLPWRPIAYVLFDDVVYDYLVMSGPEFSIRTSLNPDTDADIATVLLPDVGDPIYLRQAPDALTQGRASITGWQPVWNSLTETLLTAVSTSLLSAHQKAHTLRRLPELVAETHHAMALHWEAFAVFSTPR